MKKGLSFLLVVFSFILMLDVVYASGLSISASSKSVVNGNTVKVTINASGLIGKFSITSSNGSVLSGGESSVWLENESKTYTFTAKSIGSSTITVKALDVADTSGNSYTGSKSVTISVVKPREKSTNNNLKSLSIEGYTLTPEFSKDTLEYSVSLDSSVEKINIKASLDDSYASLSGTGEKEVLEGVNKFEIVVTSETGSSKTYTITATVEDSNPITKVVDGKSYNLVKRTSSLTCPDTYTSSSIDISDTTIPTCINEALNITLVGLKDDNGTINLFKYDVDTDTYTKYSYLTSKEKTVIFLDSDEAIDNYTKTTITVDNQEYNVYQSNYDSNYVLIYGMDLDTQEENWYLYNLEDKTIQTYMSNIINSMNNDFNNQIEEYKIVILGVSGLCLLLLLIIVIEIVSKKKMKKKIISKLKDKNKNEVVENTDKPKEEVKTEIKEEKSNTCKNKKKNNSKK